MATIAAAAAWFTVLGVVCVYDYLNYRRTVDNPLDHGLSKGFQELATLEYYLVWFGVAAVSLAAAASKKFVRFAFYLNLALLAETGAYCYFLAANHHLYRPLPTFQYGKFDPHPFVIAVPHPGVFLPGVTHDAESHRTTVNEGKVANPRYVYVFGGSTTYEGNIVDDRTWASDLSRLLGPGFAVKNFGVMAYSSLEDMTGSLFAFRDRPPACALYYEGWNDMRNAHYQDLRPDYSTTEIPYLTDALDVGHQAGFLERNSLLIKYAVSLFLPPRIKNVRNLTADKDLALSKIYSDNIRLIAAIGKTFGVQVIFIPQVVNPFQKGEETSFKLMSYMDEDLAKAAAVSQAWFIGVSLSIPWVREDFFDEDHFSASGALRFAQAIADDVRKICR